MHRKSCHLGAGQYGINRVVLHILIIKIQQQKPEEREMLNEGNTSPPRPPHSPSSVPAAMPAIANQMTSQAVCSPEQFLEEEEEVCGSEPRLQYLPANSWLVLPAPQMRVHEP